MMMLTLVWAQQKGRRERVDLGNITGTELIQDDEPMDKRYVKAGRWWHTSLESEAGRAL